MSNNLLSVSQIVQRGHEVRFQERGVKVIDPSGEVIATGSHDVTRGLFRFEESKERTALTCAKANIDTWHRRMGHLNFESLKRLKQGIASGVDFNEQQGEQCQICAMGKQSRLPFPKQGHRASEVLELVHSDICGPMEQPSIGGHRYYVSFTDDKTRRIFIYFLKQKSETEVTKAFNQFRAEAERQTGRKLKTLRTDNGKEYRNNSFLNLLRTLGIVHQTSTDYTPQQNGLAERVNRTIVERARCLLFQAGLPKNFWAEAVATATYLVNRSPTKGHSMTPEEAWSGRKPDLSHVRVFGVKAMAHIPKQKRKKWDAKSKEAILLGFDETTKAYRLFDPVKKDVYTCRDVLFFEPTLSGGQQSTSTASPPERSRTFVNLDFGEVPIEETVRLEFQQPSNVLAEDESSEVSTDESDASNYYSQVETSEADVSENEVGDVTIMALPPQSSSNPPESQVLRRSGRERALPGKLRDYILPRKVFPSVTSTGPSRIPVKDDGQPNKATSAEPGTGDVQQGLKASRCSNPTRAADPRSPSEALRGPDADEWRAAMKEEYRSQMDNQTWELVQLPPGKKAIGCKWIFKTKTDQKGNVVRHKARIVAQGFTQKFGIDYDEVFAPVAKQATFRTLLSVAHRRNAIVKHVDVKTAYLNGELEETIYMRQPECFSSGDAGTVCRLRRSLYGLKQSARVWNRKVDSVFKSMGFQQSKADSCLYLRQKGKSLAYILIYVDDMIIVTPDEREFMSIFKLLEENFAVTSLGDIHHFLGIEIERGESGYKLNQGTYIRKLAERFNLVNAKPSKIPLDPSYLQQKEETDRLPNNQQYLSLIGGLLYVAVHTRPDVAVSTSILAQKSSSPTQLDWNEAKRVLRYLQSTSDYELNLGSTAGDLTMFVDADWAGDTRDRKSNSGHAILFGGGVITWGSRKQTCVSLSSTEEEFVALAEGCPKLIWVSKQIAEIGKDGSRPTTVFENNQSCLKMVQSDRIERRSKHIETRYFFVLDLHQKGVIDLKYCPTEEMLADVLTKPFQRARLEKMRTMMGVLPG